LEKVKGDSKPQNAVTVIESRHEIFFGKARDVNVAFNLRAFCNSAKKC
jgi:hypothetical protein